MENPKSKENSTVKIKKERKKRKKDFSKKKKDFQMYCIKKYGYPRRN